MPTEGSRCSDGVFSLPCARLPCRAGRGGTAPPPARPAAAAAAAPSHPRPNPNAPSAPTRRAPAPAPHTKILPEMSVKKAKGELVSSLFQGAGGCVWLGFGGLGVFQQSTFDTQVLSLTGSVVHVPH